MPWISDLHRHGHGENHLPSQMAPEKYGPDILGYLSWTKPLALKMEHADQGAGMAAFAAAGLSWGCCCC